MRCTCVMCVCVCVCVWGGGGGGGSGAYVSHNSTPGESPDSANLSLAFIRMF